MATLDERRGLARWLPVAIPYLWLIVFFLVPFLIVFKISLSTSEIAQPPYVPVFDVLGEGASATWDKLVALTADNYRRIVDDSIYYEAYLSSVWIALVSTLLTLLVGYPIAYGMARAPTAWRPTLLMLVILPFWTSFLIRIYAWIGILSQEGLLNQFLDDIGLLSQDGWIFGALSLVGLGGVFTSLGLFDGPLTILSTNTAVYIGIVYSYLPFMVLPLYSALEKMDETLLEAASDLGSQPIKAFWQITFPLSLPGVIAGCFLVFIPAVGEFVIPDLLGGSDTLMIGKVMWEEFFSNRDWPAASAVAVVLLLILVVPIVLFQNQQQKSGGAHR